MNSLLAAIPELADVPLIGILRRSTDEAALAIGRIATDAGVPALEITMDGESALRQIESLAAEGIAVGAGSILTAAQVRLAVDAGARFIVSPALIAEVVEAALSMGLPPVPGAATSTEITTALRLGVPAVKVFPIHLLGGEDYLRAVMPPLHDPPLSPTGSIGLHNAAALLAAGAFAVGVGGSVLIDACPLRRSKGNSRLW